MADRKARSFIFKTPPRTNLGEVRNGIQEITGDDSIKVCQEINPFEYLVELTTDHQIQEIQEHTKIQPRHMITSRTMKTAIIPRY